MTWRDFFDRDHALYVSERHKLLHADLIAKGVAAHIPNSQAQVLDYGWAYGPGGDALRGKSAWWVTSAGGQAGDYTPEGAHGRPFADFVPPIEHIARFCGMHWLDPFVVFGGHANTPAAISACDADLLQRFAQHLAALAVTKGDTKHDTEGGTT